MGKKVKEYKAGDFIFAKVKGYPAWPARVQKLNGKKYFVYFYGTGETANLPSTMIFDYAENKDKFLTKTQKRKLFNEGVKQIEYDFANNVPIEDVVGGAIEAPADTTGNDTMNDTGNETLSDTAVGDSTLDETANDSAVENTTINDAPVEDSDENGALVIDEGKKGKKKPDPPKTLAKETPKAATKTPRGRAKKVDSTEKQDQEKLDKQEEIVSRSGRKIRPKRFVDEQTEENSTLPSPVAKKRRATTPPPPEKEKDGAKDKEKRDKDNSKLFNAVSLSELEDMKEPYVPADPEKQNILITYLPTGQYVGLKLFQSSPSAITNFKNEGAKLSYDKQQAKHAITLKTQLERGQITPQSIAAQLVLDLNLTDAEKATLDKERETEEKKSRVQFLKTEMKLIELDTKIKTCLCLEKANTELCLKLLDELQELKLKPLMVLKHPACVETVKRMRAYVGNTPSWGLSESEALAFSQRAAAIRRQCDHIYNTIKELFTVPEGLNFWEFFSERVLQFNKATSKLNADELLELVHEPLEMTVPTSHTMKTAIDAANEQEKMEEEAPAETPSKKKNTPAKKKKEATVEKEKVSSTPSKPEATDKTNAKSKKETTDSAKAKKDATDNNGKAKKDATDNGKAKKDKDETDNGKAKKDTTDNDKAKKEATDNGKAKKDATDNAKAKKDTEKPTTPTKPSLKRQSSRNKPIEEQAKQTLEKAPSDEQIDKTEPEKMETDNEKEPTQTDKPTDETPNNADIVDSETTQNDNEKSEETGITEDKEVAQEKDNSETIEQSEVNKTDDATVVKDGIEKDADMKDDEEKKSEEEVETNEKKQEKLEKEQEKEKEDEPRAKRLRETKKIESPTPRSPIKRKTKA